MILIRGCLSTFQLFDKTRYLVSMILAVWLDIGGFIWILLSSCVVFSVIFLFLTRYMREDELMISGGGILESIKMSFRMMYADYKDEFDLQTPIGCVFFALATLFMIVVMLNLLISIISDTFDRI